MQTDLADKDKNLLRDLIDQSLLVQRAKDNSISVDTEVIKRLDAIRQQYKLPSMDALEEAVTKTGQDYEDFKSQIRDQLLTQELIRKEVGSRIVISHEDVVKYYDSHKSRLRSSGNRRAERDLRFHRRQARRRHSRAAQKSRKSARPHLESWRRFWRDGQALFGQPHRFAGGRPRLLRAPQLDPKIAEKVFALKPGQMTDVMETKTGFEILQVRQRYDAGQQPLDKVEPEISNKLYEEKMEPSMRAYLETLREDSYVQIKPGYTDTAAVNADPSAKSPRLRTNAEKKKSRELLGILPKKKTGT